jgi:tRNA-dihydrouridine synthase A
VTPAWRTHTLAVTAAKIDRRLSVAPMMDVTDRHCRFFLRQITRRTVLYTEMITTGALLHGDVERHLHFHPDEHPLALQLGGSEPEDLARCAELARQYGSRNQP